MHHCVFSIWGRNKARWSLAVSCQLCPTRASLPLYRNHWWLTFRAIGHLTHTSTFSNSTLQVDSTYEHEFSWILKMFHWLCKHRSDLKTLCFTVLYHKPLRHISLPSQSLEYSFPEQLRTFHFWIVNLQYCCSKSQQICGLAGLSFRNWNRYLPSLLWPRLLLCEGSHCLRTVCPGSAVWKSAQQL